MSEEVILVTRYPEDDNPETLVGEEVPDDEFDYTWPVEGEPVG